MAERAQKRRIAVNRSSEPTRRSQLGNQVVRSARPSNQALQKSLLQTKLTINEPGDVFEKEADRMADAVMSGGAALASAAGDGSAAATVQRACACGGTCEDCQRQAAVVQRAESGSGSGATTAPPIVHEVLRSPGQSLDSGTRTFMESRFGMDFGGVRVHTDSRAGESARAVNALAYTVGRDIVFGSGQFSSGNQARQRLLAHELAHVIQQGGAQPRAATAADNKTGSKQSSPDAMPRSDERSAIRLSRMTAPALQRTVQLKVVDWHGDNSFAPPVPQNGTDPNFIDIPNIAQVLISGTVEVDGDETDDCTDWTIGTLQAAWIAWTIMYYRGQNPGDGKVTVSHHPALPIRDVQSADSPWTDESIVASPDACGDQAIVDETDGPFHSIPKTINNSAVAGNPVNFLEGYTRGLHVVTYLSAQDPDGNFLPTPLRFLYWNSLQSFTFQPDFTNPQKMWGFQGKIKANLGSKGVGAVSDAPYFPTPGPIFNDNFNDISNWRIRPST